MTESAPATIEDLLRADGLPAEPMPPPPPWHVDSCDCPHGWIQIGADRPEWLTCNCEDPAHPWPPRAPGDGPRDCTCFACHDHEPRWQRGKLASCEYKDHHCTWCHEARRCTTSTCGFVPADTTITHAGTSQ